MYFMMSEVGFQVCCTLNFFKFVALKMLFACSVSKLQFTPAVDNRGYPIKGSCDLEDVGLVSVFDSLASPQPGAALL